MSNATPSSQRPSDWLVCQQCNFEDVEQRFHGRFPANVPTLVPADLARAVVWEDRYFCPRCDAWVPVSYMDPE